MKVKFYLRMLLAAIAALFVATACSDSDDEKGPDGPGPDVKPLTFTLGVSGIEKDQAKLAVTPSDQTAVYYYNAVKKSIYDALGSDKAFLEDDLAFLQAEAAKQQMTLSAYLQSKTGRGTATYTLTGLEKQTEYYAYVYGIKLDGTVTSELVKSVFTSGEGKDDPGPGPSGKGPEFRTFSAKAGDRDGKNPETSMTVQIATETRITAGKMYINTSAIVSQALAEGYTYETLINEYGQAMDAESISIINQCVDDPGYVLATTYPGLEAGQWTVVCMVSDDNGNTTEHTSVTLGNGSGTTGNGPKLSVSLTAGDRNGANTDTQITASFDLTQATPVATSLKYMFVQTDALSELIANGATYEQIIDGNPQLVVDFSSKELEYLNDGGVSGVFGVGDPLVANTSYTLIAKAADADNNTTVANAIASTDNGSGSVEPTEAYKAWLGTWTVTSESSEVTEAPVSFDITISQNVVNSSYIISGWTITRDLADVQIPAKFTSSGGLAVPNQTKILTLDDGKIVYFICRYYDFGPDYLSYMLCQGNFDALLGTMNNGTGTITGGKINFEGDTADYWVSSMDLFVYNPTTKGWAGYSETGDYPVAPYTLTKKSAAPARIAAAKLDKTFAHSVKKLTYDSKSAVFGAFSLSSVFAGRMTQIDAAGFVMNQILYQTAGDNAVGVRIFSSATRMVRNN